MRENLIEVRNLRFAYRDKPVLKGISFDVATGDTLSILGANGSGKSTLLRIMLGFLKFEGEVLIAGKSVRDYGKKGLASLVAYVPQTHALEKMGISHLKNALYTKVSGDERQLAYIARTLVQGAKVIFMDEPTNGLDFGNQIKLLEMIKALGDEGYTFVQTTHYPRHAKFVSNLTLFLKDGEILAFWRSEQLINAENIDKIYGINYEKYKDRL